MSNLTKEEKALAIAAAEGCSIEKQRFVLRNDGRTIKVNDEQNAIERFTSYKGLMPIVERINKSRQSIIKIAIEDYLAINIIDINGKDSWSDGIIQQNFYSKVPLLDALLDAVYYVLCEAKK